MRYRALGVVLVLMGVGIAWGVWNTDGTDRSTEEYWHTRLLQRDAGAEYQRFIQYARAQTQSDQHGLAHVFGGALYDVAGMGGVGVCDSQFSFGCFHEFIGRAIRDEGLPVIHVLHKACVAHNLDNPLACQHGLGHGILAAIGYAEKDLDEARNLCAHLDDAKWVGSCYGGVYMEYNMRTMLGDDGFPREREGDLYAPCLTEPKNAQRACVYYLPQWWRVQLFGEGRGVQSTYDQIIEYCSALSGELRRSCMVGVGSNAVSDRAPTEAAVLCARAEGGDRRECLAGVMSGFGKESGAIVCVDLSGEDRAYCEQYLQSTGPVEAQGINAPHE